MKEVLDLEISENDAEPAKAKDKAAEEKVASKHKEKEEEAKIQIS